MPKIGLTNAVIAGFLIFFAARADASPELTSATYYNPGEVVLTFDSPLSKDSHLTLDDIHLTRLSDSWGGRSTLSINDDGTARITLGRTARLKLYGTYRPGSRYTPPCQVEVDGVTAPILVARAHRREFVGDRFADAADLKPYFGQLHAHTSFSDGEKVPREAYANARENGLDFFAVTDHLEQISSSGDWREGHKQANQMNDPGKFIALYGTEWGGYPTAFGWVNHVNVLGTNELLNIWSTFSIPGLYRTILELPGESVVAAFNHPGMNKPVIGRNNWDDFAYDAAADLRFNLIMVQSESSKDENNTEATGYIPALDRGWHLGPKGEEDNHHATFGYTDRRTGIWLPELTRPELLAGFVRMATFYTDNPHARLKLVADGRWLMGSTVYGDGPHSLEVMIDHPSGELKVTRIELVTRGGAVAESLAVTDPTPPLRAAFVVDPDGDAFYFARVILGSETSKIISAPIFVDE